MTLRLGICFGVLLALLASGPARAGEALVVNAGEATLSVVDIETEQELRRIPVLREPHHLTLTPDRRDLLVGDTGGNMLFDLDPVTFAERRRLPVSDPYQFGFSPDGRYLTVNGLGRNQVDVYDVATYTLLQRFPVASRPSHLAYAPDSSVVYVSLQGTGLLAAIDLHAMKVLWTAPVGSTPAGVLWLNGKVLVAIMGADYVAVADPVDGHVEQVIHTGRGAHQLFLSPDRRGHHHGGRYPDVAAAAYLQGSRRPRRHRLRARWRAVDHPALRRQGGGAGPADRRAALHPGRAPAARPVPQHQSAMSPR